MGDAQSHVSKLESGLINFQIDTLFRWCDALGLDYEINFYDKETDATVARNYGATAPDGM